MGITVQLGYPAHFIYILGVAKLSGVAVLLTPNRFLRLKEWVFAGVFFDITFAFFSKLTNVLQAQSKRLDKMVRKITSTMVTGFLKSELINPHRDLKKEIKFK